MAVHCRLYFYRTLIPIILISVIVLWTWSNNYIKKEPIKVTIIQNREPVPKQQDVRNNGVSFGPDDPRDPRFYNIITEEDALRFEPCQDIKRTASPKNSLVKIQGRPNRTYSIWETIRAIVTIYDYYGNRKYSGGDHLQATVENETLFASVPCTVTDNSDGTHTVDCLALWTGTSTIVVTLAYSREEITCLYRLRKDELSTRVINGKFKAGTIEEDVICHPNATHLLRFSNYTMLCNVTYINSGMPYFCEKPKSRSLICEDWQMIRAMSVPYHVSVCEEELIKTRPVTLKKRTQVLITSQTRKNNISVIGVPSTPCSVYNKSNLWTSRGPSGFFYNRKWRLLNCHGNSDDSYLLCLKNCSVYLFGDSTTRQWFQVFLNRFNCKLFSEKWFKEQWHKVAECYNNEHKFHVGWYPHSQPFFIGENWDEARYTQVSIARRIDSIPHNQRAIVLIHVFVHLSPYHQNVFKERMEIIRKSVERLLSRSNNSVVLIKGPHTFEDTNFNTQRFNDYSGSVFSKILFETFKGLYDRVVLLNNKDSTIAMHVKPHHPHGYIVNAMVDQMLSYACR